MSVFNFHETESFSPTFEEAGMEGSNFILGIGPIFLSMVLFPIYVAVHQMTRYIFQGQTDSTIINNFIAKKKYKSIVIKFLMEGSLELGLTALVCVVKLSKEDFETV